MTTKYSPTVLIVDDDSGTIQVLHQILEGIGKVLFASDGKQALSLLDQQAIDLVLLDAEMPEMDGFATCAAIKADPRFLDLPVIFATARADMESETQALSLGAVDFISKPFSPPVVRARVITQLALHRRNAEVRRELEARVAERTADLRVALIRAQSADRAKSDFLTIMSHEMRTPMNAIMGMAHLIQRGGLTEKQACFMEKQQHAAKQLLQLINDILNFSQVETGDFVLAHAPVNIAQVVERVVLLLGEAIASKALELVVDIDGMPPDLLGDAARLQQALLNYVSNAVKFTREGSITIRARPVPASNGGVMVRFEVEDTGVGIEAEALDRVFSLFEQADNSSTRAYGGSGLGLAITRQLARLMGGDVGVASQRGRGSSFWFTACLGRAAVASSD